MALDPKDRFTVLQNIIARVGGMDKVDLRAELARAEAGVNYMGTQMNSPMSPNQDATGNISPSMGTNPTQGEIVPETPQNIPQNTL